ncbi:MAG: hypothetical protein D6765_17525 [Bacteroidetes bacterium]|nr:MAG: hypothetical protein D6765_17525 [Bacteroidota bacterium]
MKSTTPQTRHPAAVRPSDESRLFFRLKHILLKEDREELERLRASLEDPQWLESRVGPLIDERLAFLKKNFPKEFRLAVEKIVDQKIASSQDALIEAISPHLMKMVRAFIQHQFTLLRENIEQQLRKLFNTGPLGRLRLLLFGIEPETLATTYLGKIGAAQVEEIYVVEQHSGILLGSASRTDKPDLDLVAGMLTAIKSFAEDAYQQGRQHLEMIAYGEFSIFIQNFPTYYIALVTKGELTTSERQWLSEKLIEFARNELNFNLKKPDGSSNLLIRRKLQQHFFSESKSA